MDYLLSWDNIDNDGHSFVSGKRISVSCIPELDYGITNKNQRCLILYLSKNFSAEIKAIDKLHLSLKFVKSQNAVVLTLKDLIFFNLFDDLIHSIYKEIHDKKEDKIIVQLFITTFLKWSEFFEDNNHSKMTKNEVQGLFGELHVLHQLIKNNVGKIDTLLSSWRGPYKEPHDFAFSTVDIEVKAIQSSKNTISITSEQQLENIRQSILDFHGDYSLFYKALSELELTPQNVAIYNNFKFTVISDRQFNTQIDSFPKLTSKELPKAISKLKYNLNLEQISEFEIERSYCVS